MKSLFKISLIFIKKNINKSISIILTAVMFLLILNLTMGIILSFTSNLGSSVVNNNAMYFVEINYNTGVLHSKKISLLEKKEEILNRQHVKTAFIDLGHPTGLDTEDMESKLTNLLGIPKECLPYFGINIDSDEEFLFVPDSFGEKYQKGQNVSFEEGEYQKNGAIYEGVLKRYNRTITGQYEEGYLDFFPPNQSLIDENTAIEIAKKMTKDDNVESSRIFAIIPDVDKLKEFEDTFSNDESVDSVKYTLKSAKGLPQYAVILIASSSLIILLIFIISVINIYNNIKNLMNARSRDIALYNILGAKKSTISMVFLSEFIFYGILAFILGSLLTLGLLYTVKLAFSLDIISNYIFYYLSCNFILSIFLFGTISYIQIKLRIRNLSLHDTYKENLK